MHAPRPPHRPALALFALIVATAIALALATMHARAAALLDLNGQKVIVMTADEFAEFVAAKDEEIAQLRARLDTRRRVDCPLI